MNEPAKAVVSYRMRRSEETLLSAELLLQKGMLFSAVKFVNSIREGLGMQALS